MKYWETFYSLYTTSMGTKIQKRKKTGVSVFMSPFIWHQHSLQVHIRHVASLLPHPPSSTLFALAEHEFPRYKNRLKDSKENKKKIRTMMIYEEAFYGLQTVL